MAAIGEDQLDMVRPVEPFKQIDGIGMYRGILRPWKEINDLSSILGYTLELYKTDCLSRIIPEVSVIEPEYTPSSFAEKGKKYNTSLGAKRVFIAEEIKELVPLDWFIQLSVDACKILFEHSKLIEPKLSEFVKNDLERKILLNPKL